MPRKARVLVPNCPHHIVQRGHNRKAVFLEEQDYRYYLENLLEWKESLSIRVYAWCLMTNHIHLILEPGNDPMAISTLMKRVNGRQSAYINRQEGRSGTLWEGRYKGSPIQSDTYLLACVRYVELNPVKAGMVGSPEEYLWSSCRDRLVENEDGLLDIDPYYRGLGATSQQRWQAYGSFLNDDPDKKVLAVIQNGVQRNQLTGNGRFVDEIEQRVGFRVERRGRGRPGRGDK